MWKSGVNLLRSTAWVRPVLNEDFSKFGPKTVSVISSSQYIPAIRTIRIFLVKANQKRTDVLADNRFMLQVVFYS